MGAIPVKFRGDAAAAIAYLANETGWSAEEVLGTLLNIGLDMHDQGVFADVDNKPAPMGGVNTMEAWMDRVNTVVTDPDGDLVRITAIDRVDGNVVALVTTDVNSAVTGKVDVNTYVHRLADLAPAHRSPQREGNAPT